MRKEAAPYVDTEKKSLKKVLGKIYRILDVKQKIKFLVMSKAIILSRVSTAMQELESQTEKVKKEAKASTEKKSEKTEQSVKSAKAEAKKEKK